MLQPSQKDQALDAAMACSENEEKDKKKKIQRSLVDIESLVLERQHEEEDNVALHVMTGGCLVVTFFTTLTFSMGKSAGIDLLTCGYISLAVFFLGNLPFATIWAWKNKDSTAALLLVIPNGLLLVYSLFVAFWFCLVYCQLPKWLYNPPHEPELSSARGDREHSVSGCASWQRKCHAILCCWCQYGPCLCLTPRWCSCAQWTSSCSQASLSCCRTGQRKRRDTKRRIALVRLDEGSVSVQEVSDDGKTQPARLNKEERRVVQDAMDESSSRKSRRRGERLTSPRQKASMWKSMFSGGRSVSFLGAEGGRKPGGKRDAGREGSPTRSKTTKGISEEDYEGRLLVGDLVLSTDSALSNPDMPGKSQTTLRRKGKERLADGEEVFELTVVDASRRRDTEE